jgi:hypothetical protein
MLRVLVLATQGRRAATTTRHDVKSADFTAKGTDAPRNPLETSSHEIGFNPSCDRIQSAELRFTGEGARLFCRDKPSDHRSEFNAAIIERRRIPTSAGGFRRCRKLQLLQNLPAEYRGKSNLYSIRNKSQKAFLVS